jgi:methylmalonyl-CoA mutase cobalamin-binding domain/chain
LKTIEVEMREDLSILIIELKRDEVAKIVKERAEKGEDPADILDECRNGMIKVGELFQIGEYYLAELMLSAEILKGAVTILDPYIAGARQAESKGKVVLATLKGDIHDLGKNIFGNLLKAHGFEVHDLGTDVNPEAVVDKVKAEKSDFVGFSALITTAFDSMKQATDMLEVAGLRKNIKIMVGGGVTDPAIKKYINADFQTLDAMEGVAYCLKEVGA